MARFFCERALLVDASLVFTLLDENDVPLIEKKNIYKFKKILNNRLIYDGSMKGAEIRVRLKCSTRKGRRWEADVSKVRVE
jgi:hypothetical protein